MKQEFQGEYFQHKNSKDNTYTSPSTVMLHLASVFKAVISVIVRPVFKQGLQLQVAR